MWILKAIGGPGSAYFLVASLALGLAVSMAWPAKRMLARAWMGLIILGYGVLSLPFVASAIAAGLPEVNTAPRTRAIDTLVVLAGDNWGGRLRQTVIEYRAGAAPSVRVLGNRLLADEVRDVGIPAERITLDEGTSNTREQMGRVRELIETGSLGRTAVLASAVQLPRVAGLARALNLDVVLVAAPIDRPVPARGLKRFVPAPAALSLSRDAIYEHAALLYYRRRGWIPTGP